MTDVPPVVQLTHDQFVALMAAVQKPAGAMTYVGDAAKSAVAEVEAVASKVKVNWPHFVTFLTAAAGLAMHFVKFLP